MTLNLWKLELRIVWIHFAYLFSCRCAQDLDDLHQLIDTRVAREDGLAQQQLGQNATGTPHICKGIRISFFIMGIIYI